jgi:PAS domain S-box-containing protein
LRRRAVFSARADGHRIVRYGPGAVQAVERFPAPTSVVFQDARRATGTLSRLRPYGVALASVAVAAAVRAAVDPVFGDRLPFVTFALAVLFVVSSVGAAPAVVAAIVGFAAGSWYFVDPRQSFAVRDVANVLRDAGYFAVTFGSIVSVVRVRRLRHGVASAELTRQALFTSEERFRAIAEALPQVLFTARPDGTADYVNRRLHDFTGAPVGDADGKQWLPYVHPDDVVAVGREWKNAIRAGRPFDTEFRMRRADGEYRWFKCRSVPVRDTSGAIAQWVGSSMEIEDRKRAEADLTTALDAMARARDAAEAANRAKDDFLAVLSHELRSPLSAMVGWLWLLRREIAGQPAALRALDTLERNVRAQSQLIDDLLDVSRIVSGKLRLEFETTDLAQVVRAAVDAIRPAAAGKHVTLACDVPAVPLPVEGDAERLAQVAGNLLANAVKFTPEGGRIAVTAGREDADAVVVVRDSGEGVAPALLPHVFDRFKQGDASTVREHGGLGLGLAIVHHVVERHGGTVTAWSPGPGLGATFTVRLPVARRAAAPVPATARTPDASRSRLDAVRVLLVDDEPDTRAALSLALEANGASVVQAGSVREALADFDRLRPEVIVSDISMPGEDGYALLRRIRDAGGRVTPAVAVTGLASTRDREQALHAGFDGYLAKPVQPDVLVDTVEMLAATRRGRRDADQP